MTLEFRLDCNCIFKILTETRKRRNAGTEIQRAKNVLSRVY